MNRFLITALFACIQFPVYGQEVRSAAAQTPQLSTPDTEFLLSREFDRLSKKIEDIESWRSQIKRDRNQLLEILQGKSSDPAEGSFRQNVTEIARILRSMSEDKYWLANAPELVRRFEADVSTLERNADRLLSLRSITVVRQARSVISRRINESKDARLLEAYLSIDRLLQGEPESQFNSATREALQFLSFRELERLAFGSAGDRSKGAVNRTDTIKAKMPELISAVERVSVPTDRLANLRQQIESAFTKLDSELDSEMSNGKKQLEVIARKIEDLKKKGDSTFGSTNYMMLLLAFSFGLTVALRAFRNEPIITDQTLVEYGGMCFLILALIILASGDKIKSDTVGPLLGTVAGYIFGRSVSLHGTKRRDDGDPQQTPSSQTTRQDGDAEGNFKKQTNEAAEARAKSMAMAGDQQTIPGNIVKTDDAEKSG